MTRDELAAAIVEFLLSGGKPRKCHSCKRLYAPPPAGGDITYVRDIDGSKYLAYTCAGCNKYQRWDDTDLNHGWPEDISHTLHTNV